MFDSRKKTRDLKSRETIPFSRAVIFSGNWTGEGCGGVQHFTLHDSDLPEHSVGMR
jgi:hypothetical protein